jgi:hypothetical protein
VACLNRDLFQIAFRDRNNLAALSRADPEPLLNHREPAGDDLREFSLLTNMAIFGATGARRQRLWWVNVRS